MIRLLAKQKPQDILQHNLQHAYLEISPIELNGAYFQESVYRNAALIMDRLHHIWFEQQKGAFRALVCSYNVPLMEIARVGIPWMENLESL